MKVYTVKELRDELDRLCSEGRGNNPVLIPDETEGSGGEYRTIGSIDDSDYKHRYVYFEYNDDEEERDYWNEIEGV